MINKNIFLIPLALLFLSCSSDDNLVVGEVGNGGGSGSGSGNENSGATGTWTIPINEVWDGGPGKDGIPSIDNPVFLEADDIEVDRYMNDDDLVIGIVKGDIVKAYPHRILDWHEIVNDEFSGEKITISYCPLTGTAFGWEGKINGKESTFGVSGLLYNSNLLLYDRDSDSHWSQLKLECVNGKFIRNKPKVVNVVETTWRSWKEMFPNTQILSDKQGFSRNYSIYPYADYKEDPVLFFPVSKSDNSIPKKDRVHAIIAGEAAKVFKFSHFGNGKVIRSKFLSDNILIVGDQKMINSYILGVQHTNLIFKYDFTTPDYYFKDNEGNKWNVLGIAVEGPRKGEALLPTNSLMSYWFAIPPFFSNVEIH